MKINEKNLCYFATSPPVDREGWLQKRGDVNKSWQRRYFVLKGNLLFYFEKKGDREPLGVIILEGCTIGEWQSNCMLARIVEQMLLICRFDFRIGRRGRAILFPNCISWHQQSNIFPQCRITRDVSTRVQWVIQFRVRIINVLSIGRMERWMKALTCAGYEYMKLMVAELQRQLDEIEVCKGNFVYFICPIMWTSRMS